MSRLIRVALASFLAAACAKPPPSGTGPVVAKGSGITVTSDELVARLDEQPPVIRMGFKTPEKRREFLDTVVRFELLAQRARKEGLENDPDVQFAIKKVLVAKYYEHHFGAPDAGAPISDAQVQAFYNAHITNYQRPARVHAFHLFVAAEPGSDRAARKAMAQKALERILADEPRDPLAFQATAGEISDEQSTKRLGGDLNFVAREQLEHDYGKPVAEATFAQPMMTTCPTVIETPEGFHVVRVAEVQPELLRPIADVRASITTQLKDEQARQDYEAFLERLVKEAGVQVDEAQLDKVAPHPLPNAHG